MRYSFLIRLTSIRFHFWQILFQQLGAARYDRHVQPKCSQTHVGNVGFLIVVVFIVLHELHLCFLCVCLCVVSFIDVYKELYKQGISKENLVDATIEQMRSRNIFVRYRAKKVPAYRHFIDLRWCSTIYLQASKLTNHFA